MIGYTVISRKFLYLVLASFFVVCVAVFFHFRTSESTLVEPVKTPAEIEQAKTEALLASLPRTTIATPFDPAFSVIETSFLDKKKVCNITHYGAKGDGVSKNTTAFAQAIDDCAQKGGGQVLVPAGVWLTGPIHLQSNIDLHIEKGAEILFSTDFNDYLPVVFSRFEGVEYYNYSPPIYAKDCTNVAITGEGELNGQGEKSWWKLNVLSPSIGELYRMGGTNTPVAERIFGSREGKLRPAFVEFVNCNVVLLDGITLRNGPMWTIHPVYSENVIIRNIQVSTVAGRSTDGIAIDSTRNVLIENSTLSTGDDAIVIKSGRDTDGIRVAKPSENIVVRNCTIPETHAGIAIGSEVSGGVRNVYATHLTVGNATFGVRIKSAPGRQGIVDGIWIDDVTIHSSSDAAVALDNLYETRTVVDKNDVTPLRNIFISNIASRRAKKPLFIRGHDGDSIRDVTIDQFSVLSNNDVFITDATNITIKHLSLTSDSKKDTPLFFIKNSQNIQFEESSVTEEQVRCTDCTYKITKTQ